MYVVCVTSNIKPGMVDAYVAESVANAKKTRGEPGNLRFDVLRGHDNPQLVFFYEVYKTPADFAAHQQTSHYLHFKETVKDMLVEPRSGVKYDNAYPAGDEGWRALPG